MASTTYTSRTGVPRGMVQMESSITNPTPASVPVSRYRRHVTGRQSTAARRHRHLPSTVWVQPCAHGASTCESSSRCRTPGLHSMALSPAPFSTEKLAISYRTTNTSTTTPSPIASTADSALIF